MNERLRSAARWRDWARQWGPAAALIAGLLVLWEVGVRLTDAPPWLLPAPSAVAAAFVDAGPQLWQHTGRTLVETAAGLLASVVTGVALAVAVDLLPPLRRAIYPLLVVSQTIPIIALAPLLVVWFGFGLLPRVLVVTLVCFFPIVISTAQGLAAADPDMVALLSSMGADRWMVFRKVRLPGALPAALSGLRIAATYAVMGAVISEWIGASQGLGVFMIRSANSYLTARLFAAIALTSVLSIALFGLVVLLERWAVPWYFAARREERWEEMR